jgi:hypothetical protein
MHSQRLGEGRKVAVDGLLLQATAIRSEAFVLWQGEERNESKRWRNRQRESARYQRNCEAADILVVGDARWDLPSLLVRDLTRVQVHRGERGCICVHMF